AQPEEEEAAREEPPRALRLGAVHPQAREDREHGREPEQVHHRAAAGERRHPDVERAQDRARGQVEPPGLGPPQRSDERPGGHRQAACSISASTSAASLSSPISARSRMPAIAWSTSASVLAAVTWKRKPTSFFGTSGKAASVT